MRLQRFRATVEVSRRVVNRTFSEVELRRMAGKLKREGWGLAWYECRPEEARGKDLG